MFFSLVFYIIRLRSTFGSPRRSSFLRVFSVTGQQIYLLCAPCGIIGQFFSCPLILYCTVNVWLWRAHMPGKIETNVHGCNAQNAFIVETKTEKGCCA